MARIHSPEPLDAEVYANLTKKTRRKFNALCDVMRSIARAPKVTPACIAAAQALLKRDIQLSPERIRKLWYAYALRGEAALVDHNLCGGRCGLPDCSTRNLSLLKQETIDHWIRLAEQSDKPSLRNSWKELIALLSKGEQIDGVGTWRSLWSQLNPHKPLPAKCPWSVHRPPSGWSLPSFMAKKPSNVEFLAAKKGLAAAETELALSLPIRTDLTELRFMEVVVFDDHRLDFKAWVGKEIVELWAVFAMDLSTRTILAWGVRPRLANDDGSKQSLTRRDMQHLIAGMLSKHGYPKDYTCTLLCENAAAAITSQVENDIRRVTRGQVIVDRSGVGSGRSIGFEEKYGKPRGKRWLESWFNIFEIELGRTPGQMGNRWENQRGDFKARENLGIKLARMEIMEQLPAEARPFPSLEEARAYIHDAILKTEAREQHALEYFGIVRLWRVNDSDSWKSCDDAFFLSLPLEQQNRLMEDRATGLIRPERPDERRARLHDPQAFTSLTAGGTAFLLLDVVAIDKYAGTNAITFKFAGRTFDFSGTEHRALPGQKLVARFDADHPDHCTLEDEQGRILGFMRQRRAANMFEKERIGEQLGERQKAIGKAVHNVRTRHADPNVAAAYDAATRIITAEIHPAAAEAEEDASIAPVIEAYAEAQQPAESDAEKYLKLTSKRRRKQAPATPQPTATPPSDISIDW
jgi:hypothetical protein